MTIEKNSFTSDYPRAYTPTYVPPTNLTWWRRVRWTDFYSVYVIMVMLVWPWIFFGTVWSRKGIPLQDNLANFVTNHPQKTTFFITFLGNVVRLIVAFLFSRAVLRFSQEFMTEHHLNLFHLSLISGFKNQKLPWGTREIWYLCRSQRWLHVAVVAACWAIFLVVPSSTTSLLSPVPFNKVLDLNRQELNFSSTAADCLDWLQHNSLLVGIGGNDTCGWMPYNGASFTTCLVENQLEDVLESGRANMLDGPDTESFFSQINAEFLGPIRGILPLGSDGVFAFDTVDDDSPVPDPATIYNYTLYHQGIDFNISCNYDSQSPIVVSGTPGDKNTPVLKYNGTCDGPGESNILDASSFMVLNSGDTLTFWACKSSQSEAEWPSYAIYFRGIGSVYEKAIGNITCSISEIHSAVFPVLYQNTAGYFSPGDPTPDNSTIFPGLIDQSMISLGGLVEECQGRKAGNLLAESIFTFGIKYNNLSLNDPDPMYPQLYEWMIKGVLEYLVTYTRLIYNLYSGTKDPAPSSCYRSVKGTFNYQILGWSVNADHIGFLMPLTIVNLASLVLMIFAILGTKSGSYKYDPVNAKSLVLADIHVERSDPSGWSDVVIYRDREPNDVPADAQSHLRLAVV